jgi:hypothetical protein
VEGFRDTQIRMSYDGKNTDKKRRTHAHHDAHPVLCNLGQSLAYSLGYLSVFCVDRGYDFGNTHLVEVVVERRALGYFLKCHNVV